jgi:hypothetical protein
LEAQADGTRCSDGNACTVTDRCAAACASAARPVCDDGDPCTRDAATRSPAASSRPSTASRAALHLSQRRIQFECRDPLPDALAGRLAKAELLLTVAAAEPRLRTARRTVKRAVIQARKARRFARNRRDRGLLPFRCAQAVVEAMDALVDRGTALRRQLR